MREQILKFCYALKCNGVFLCSDDIACKDQLLKELKSAQVKTFSFNALLSKGYRRESDLPVLPMQSDQETRKGSRCL
eukprot:symbB.v1.2.032303.t1/scaffold3862.1/size49131/2